MSPVKRLLKLTKLFEIKVREMQINDPAILNHMHTLKRICTVVP
jgi:hypothetical protein